MSIWKMKSRSFSRLTPRLSRDYDTRSARSKGSQLIEESTERSSVARAHMFVHMRAHTHIGRRCMPAGVIDISKCAMADRSQRVLVRTTAALPTPARTTNAPASLYRAIHPSGVSRKIQFGKSSRSAEERPRQSAASPLFHLLGFP